MEESRITAGELLYRLRTQQGIRQEELCWGLCAKSAYSRYESGERRIDRLLLNCLLERLGKDPDQLFPLLTEEEYGYFHWRENVLAALRAGNIREAETALARAALAQAEKPSVNQKLQKQFTLFAQGMLAEQRGREVQAREAYRLAAETTLPDLETGVQRHVLSVTELEILTCWAGLEEKQDWKRAVRLLEGILRNVEERFGDSEVKARLLPGAAKRLAEAYLAMGRNQEALVLCQEALYVLEKNGLLSGWEALFALFIRCGGTEEMAAEADRYAELGKGLESLSREFGCGSLRRDCFPGGSCRREVYLAGEVIAQERVYRGLSQETLCEGICAPGNLSRLENGGRGRKETISRLLDRLELDKRFFPAGLDMLDCGQAEDTGLPGLAGGVLCQRQTNEEQALSGGATGRRRPDEEQALSGGATGRRRPDEGQALSGGESDLRRTHPPEEIRAACGQLLGCGAEAWKEEGFWRQFLTEKKCRLLGCLAESYAEEGDDETALFLVERVLGKLEESRVSLRDRSGSVLDAMSRRCRYLYGLGRKEEWAEGCCRGIRLSVEWGRLDGVEEFLPYYKKALEGAEGSGGSGWVKIF